MKTLIFAFLTISVLLIFSDASKKQEEEIMDYKDAVVECLDEMQLTDEDYEEIEGETDGLLYCILSCADTKVKSSDGLIMDAKMIDREQRTDLTQRNITYTDEMKAAMDRCVEIGNNSEGDGCQKAKVYFICTFTNKLLKKITSKASMKGLIRMSRKKLLEKTLAPVEDLLHYWGRIDFV